MKKIEIVFKCLNILKQEREFMFDGEKVTTTYDLNSAKSLCLLLSMDEIKKHRQYKLWVYLKSPLYSFICSFVLFFIVLMIINIFVTYNIPSLIEESVALYISLFLILHFFVFKKKAVKEVIYEEMNRVARENNKLGSRLVCCHLEDWGSFIKRLLHDNTYDRRLLGYYKILEEHSNDIKKLKRIIYKEFTQKNKLMNIETIKELNEAITIWEIFEKKIINYCDSC